MEKKDKPIVISEKTLLPISFVLVILGFAAWLGYVAQVSVANTASIHDIKSYSLKKEDAIVKELKEINTRLSKIEGKLSK